MSVVSYDGPACPISFLHVINTVRFSPSAHASGRSNIMTETRYDALSRIYYIIGSIIVSVIELVIESALTRQGLRTHHRPRLLHTTWT